MEESPAMAATAVPIDESIQPTRRQQAAPYVAMDPLLRDVVLSASLANLSLMGAWRKILYLEPAISPIWTWRDLVAIAINLVLLSAVFFALIRLLSYLPKRFSWLRTLLFVMPVYAIINVGRESNNTIAGLFTQPGPLKMMACILAVAAVIALAHWDRRVVRIAENIAVLLIILVPLNFAPAAYLIYKQPAEPPLAGFLPANPPHRVVWIIFDELDGEIALHHRPVSVHLPQIDRLRQSSVDAFNTHEANTDTDISMTSLLYGQHVYHVGRFLKNTLLLQFQPKGEYKNPLPKDSLFTDVRKMGINAGVAGWYLPYCRMFAASLADCYAESMETRVSSEEPNLLISIEGQLRTLSPWESRRRHLYRYEAMMHEATTMSADTRLGLLLLHLPVPHGPGIYYRSTDQLTAWRLGGNWYYDNLALADRTLGQIRSAMEKAGEWDNTAVLVSSDHAVRPYAMGGPRHTWVPFILKMPGQTKGIAMRQPINALVTRDLIDGILRGQIATADDASRWLAAHKTNSPAN